MKNKCIVIVRTSALLKLLGVEWQKHFDTIVATKKDTDEHQAARCGLVIAGKLEREGVVHFEHIKFELDQSVQGGKQPPTVECLQKVWCEIEELVSLNAMAA